MATADGYSVRHFMEAGLSLKRCRDLRFLPAWGAGVYGYKGLG